MTRAAFASVSTALVVLCLAGCGHSPDSGKMDDTASIVLALTTVPSDVSCLEVTVSGAQTTTQRFDVTPNQAATITVQGLASGAATISERAFAVPCAQVTATTNPTWLSTMAVSVTLTPGEITDVTIVLRRAGQVRITTDFQDGTGATFSVSPPMVAFGNVTVPTAATMIVNITNTGTTAVAPPSLALSGPDAQLFTIQSSPNTGNPPCATTPSLPAGAACAVQIRFAPTSIGPKTATLNVGTAAGGTTPAATVPLSGTGVVMAAFSASPNPVAFGPLMVGFNSLMVVNITNTGTTAVAPPSLSLSGPDATQFSIQTPAGTGNPPCATTASVPAGGACATAIVFTPTSGGAKSATLNIATAGMVVTTVDLSGIGQATPPVLSASPNPVAFGNVGVGASVTTVVTITNTGMSVVAMTSFISGTDSSQFTIVNTGNTGDPPCSSTASLAVGAACAAQIRFAPTSAGAKSASLSVGLTSAGTTVLTVPITGTGGTPPASFSVSPNPIAFGSLMVGFNTNIVVSITNTGTTAVAPPSLSLSGLDAAQFAIQSSLNTGNPPCATTASLPAGAACATTIVFSPTTGGAKSATLNLASAGMVVTTVAVTGTSLATPPMLSASPNPAAFGNVGIGAGATITINFTNTGMVAVASPSPGLSGTDGSQFAFVNTGNTGNPPCSSTTSLAVGAVCAVQIRFAPTSAGAKSATLSLGVTSAGTPVITVPLTGTGVTATFSATPNPLNLGGVSIGASSSGIVTITNTSSFATAPPALSIGGTNAGQFAVVATTNTGNPPCATATSLPAGGACTTSVRFTPASAGAKTATLNIGTAANGTPAATVALTGSGV